MSVENKIWYLKRYIKIDINSAPDSERKLLSFLSANNAPKCFVKTGNAWRKVTKEGSILYVSRTLYLLSYKEWLEIALNDNFIANTP